MNRYEKYVEPHRQLILAEHKSVFASKEDDFWAMDGMFLDCQAAQYADDGSVTQSFGKGE